MPDDLLNFARRMKITSVKVEKGANAMVFQTMAVVLQELVRATPVDTGQARSNWLVSLDIPRSDVVPAHAPGRHLGLNESANAQATIREGLDAMSGRKTGQEVWITNNIYYIGRLNDGSSTQAPAMFVQKAVQAGRQKAASMRIFRSG